MREHLIIENKAALGVPLQVISELLLSEMMCRVLVMMKE